MAKKAEVPDVIVVDTSADAEIDYAAVAELLGGAERPDEPKESEPKKKSEPKPGDPDYDWSGHYDTTDLYSHTFPNGTVVAIKPFASIYSKTWLYKVRALQTDVDIEFAAIDRAACETAKEILMNLDDTEGDPLADLYAAWLAAGTKQGDKGLSAGE